ncbi:MAG TPA: alginate lyase family protein [Verrucomicrobiae bacterium]|jgi:hypothetical protein
MRLRSPLFALLFVSIGAFAATKETRVFGASPGALPLIKAQSAKNDPSLLPALKKLKSDANKALGIKPLSVMEKPRPGASGDKHDYFSHAPYFWPNPTNATGLPYIRKDGSRNPESGNEFSDAPRMGRMADTGETLALAFYFFGDEAHAAQATKLLRAWFLNPATRMNPNFNQAQAIPGVNNGRGIGMIESRSLMQVCDAVGLLAGSTNWSSGDDAGMRQWMREFLEWAQTSKNGKDEQAAKNNHGSWYDSQISHLALFVGETNLARRVIESAKTNRIALQIKPDGSQPLELARENSFGYSRFNLQALFTLATLGEHAGVDLWHFKTDDGASLRAALDFLLPYVEQPKKEWPYERGKKDERTLYFVPRKAAAVYRDERYGRAAKSAAANAREILMIPLN